MKCASVRKALPLFVGGDLDACKAREISAHLARCEGCRAPEAGLRKSRAWLESAPPPPGDEADFAAIRRGVWLRIEADRIAMGEDRRHAGGVVLAGGILTGALMAVFLFLRAHSDVSVPATAGLSPVAVGQAAPSPRAAENLPAPAPRRAIRQVSRARLRRPAPATRPGVVRIEFQTANPNVRIIWLVKRGDEIRPAATGRNQEVS